MLKVSRVNARLFAKMHLRQVDTLIRLAAIENGIGTMLNKSVPRLIDIITSESGALKSSAFGNVVQGVLDNIRIMLRKQLREHIMRSHRSAVEVLDQSLPRRLFELLVPIEPTFEWIKPPRQGRIIARGGELKLVYEDSFGVPKKLTKKNLTDAEKHKIRLEVLFPPPSQQDVAQILAQGRYVSGPGGSAFETWEERFDGLSRLINDKKVAFSEIARGYSEGENITQIRKRLDPLVGGIRSSAQRIARTEGMRVAEQMQRSTWSNLGDMMVGAQIIAVLDERTRPEHATRNGRIYYRQPTSGQKSMGELPDLPDAPNCRCMTIPVMDPPPEFKDDPEIRRAFEQTASPGTGEPATYNEWFADALPDKRKMVTGVERYRVVEQALAGTREPKWSDFIDVDGNLLSVEALANETAVARTARTRYIDKEIENQKKLLLDVQRQGFITPPDATLPPPVVAPAPVEPPPPKPMPAPAVPKQLIDPKIVDTPRDYTNASANAGHGGKAVIANMKNLLAPDRVRKQVDLFNEKTRDVSEARKAFLEKIAPDKKAVKQFEKMKAEWEKSTKKAMEILKSGDKTKAIFMQIDESKRLREKYGEDAFYRMIGGKGPATAANVQRELAQAINPGGSKQDKIKTKLLSSDNAIQEKTELAQEWLNSLIPDASPINLDVKVELHSGRAYASPAESSIHMDPKDDVAVFVHEIAHIIEGKVGKTADASKAIRFAQTVGQETQHLKSINDAYADNEITMGDQWKGVRESSQKYVSKYYAGDDYTEVVSIGLEMMYRDPGTLAAENPDYFDFLVNVLRGNYAK